MAHNQTGNESVLTKNQLATQIRENLKTKDWNGCVGCADCCTMFSVTLGLKSEMEEFATVHFGQPTDKIQVKNHHVCSKLDPKTRKCTIYEDRPKICREFLCDASKTRANIQQQIRKEIEENHESTDHSERIDIYPYLSKIGGS